MPPKGKHTSRTMKAMKTASTTMKSTKSSMKLMRKMKTKSIHPHYSVYKKKAGGVFEEMDGGRLTGKTPLKVAKKAIRSLGKRGGERSFRPTNKKVEFGIRKHGKGPDGKDYPLRVYTGEVRKLEEAERVVPLSSKGKGKSKQKQKPLGFERTTEAVVSFHPERTKKLLEFRTKEDERAKKQKEEQEKRKKRK